MPVAFAPATLVGIICESMLFGCFLALFSFTMMAWKERFYSQHPHARGVPLSQRLLLTASTIIAVSIVVHWICNVWRIYDAFIINGGTPTGPARDLGRVSNVKNVVKTAMFVTQALVGDLVMLWRVYTVWGGSIWVLIFPTMAVISEIVSGIGVIRAFIVTPPSTANVFNPAVGNWITAAFSSALAMNLYSSVAILGKLWFASRFHKGSSALTEVMNLFAESVFLWSAFIATTFFTFLARSNVQYSFVDMTSPVLGIAFCWLMLRVNLRTKTPYNTHAGSRSGMNATANVSIPLRPVAIDVVQTTITDVDKDGYHHHPYAAHGGGSPGEDIVGDKDRYDYVMPHAARASPGMKRDMV